jgi:MFS family permease
MRYRWVVLGVATGAQVVYSTLAQGLPALAPLIRSTYALRLDQVGVALSAVLAGQMCTQYLWGHAVDRFGDRRSIVVGLVGAGAAACAASATGGFGVFVACLFIIGLLGASVNISGGRSVAQWFAFSARGLAMGIRQSGLPLGGAVGAAALPALALTLGLHGALLVVAGAFGITAVLAAVWLREPAAPATSARAPSRLTLDRLTLSLVASGALLCVPQFGILTFAALFLHDEAGVPVSTAALVLGGMQAAGAVARIAAGLWSDRAGVRIRPLRTIAAAIAIADVAVAACAGSSATVVAGALLVAGVLGLAWNALIPAVLVEVVGPAHVGRAIGLLTTAQAVSATATPPLFALVVSATSYRVGFGQLAPVAVVAFRLLRSGSVAERRSVSAAGAPARSTA